MPVNVVKTPADEKHWNAAKKAAEAQGRGNDYAYVMGIFQKMSGAKKALSKGFYIPAQYSTYRIPGQVPGYQDPDAREAFRMANTPPQPFSVARLLAYDEPILGADSVTRGLGLAPDRAGALARFVEELANVAANEIILRQGVMERAMVEGLDLEQTRAVLQRTLTLYRGLGKSRVAVFTPDDLRKARAERGEAGETKSEPDAKLTVAVTRFLQDNPNPEDQVLHAWAEKRGYNVHEVEDQIYRLATSYTKFVGGGRSNQTKFSEADADPRELAMGIKVELEHTPDRATARRIALDHLAEMPDYYSRLKRMEAGGLKKALAFIRAMDLSKASTGAPPARPGINTDPIEARVLKAVHEAGGGGCELKSMAGLARRYGPKKIAEILRNRCGGKVEFKKGRFFPVEPGLAKSEGDASARTAIARSTLSAPMAYLRGKGLLRGKVLDYGSGRGTDARKVGADKYDPNYAPEKPDRQYDTITCNYVLNVIPPKEAAGVVARVKRLLKPGGKAYFAVRRDIEKPGKTTAGTYQRNVKMSLPVLHEEAGSYAVYELSKSWVGNASVYFD